MSFISKVWKKLRKWTGMEAMDDMVKKIWDKVKDVIRIIFAIIVIIILLYISLWVPGLQYVAWQVWVALVVSLAIAWPTLVDWFMGALEWFFGVFIPAIVDAVVKGLASTTTGKVILGVAIVGGLMWLFGGSDPVTVPAQVGPQRSLPHDKSESRHE